MQVTLLRLGFKGTAAGNRRRFPMHAVAALMTPVLGALVLMALAFVALPVACARHQVPNVDGARRAARKAIQIVRPSAPTKARLIEQLVALAEVATAAEAAAPWWQGSVGRTEAAWLRVVRTAHDTTTAARAVESSARRAYTTLHTDVRDEVVRAQAEIGEAGMGRREAAAMQQALLSLKLAERLAEAGRHQPAVEELREARQGAAVVHHEWASLHARFGEPSNLRQWQAWAEMTIEESRRAGETAILVDKLRRRVTLYRDGKAVVHFPAELGANGLRRKEHAGDRATPEGMYRVVQVKEASKTRFYKALLINYPNDEDRMRFALGQRRGQISAAAGIGSLIEIHGDGGEGRDWTNGCIALTNEDMDRLFAHVHVGTPVTIVGTYGR
ncbi:MAG TPA: L,D-transpeptidase [Thermoanaerobaculaceae bacterium]|nr:L,D-transpeptidase [Thermoanaerobaculaceae bacterium]